MDRKAKEEREYKPRVWTDVTAFAILMTSVWIMSENLWLFSLIASSFIYILSKIDLFLIFKITIALSSWLLYREVKWRIWEKGRIPPTRTYFKLTWDYLDKVKTNHKIALTEDKTKALVSKNDPGKALEEAIKSEDPNKYVFLSQSRILPKIVNELRERKLKDLKDVKRRYYSLMRKK